MVSSNFSNQENYNYWTWNGFKIAWRVLKEENKQPILLLHGFGASSDHWRKNINFYADQGYSVYMIDLLGFGKSDQPGVKEFSPLDNGVWCDQIIDFITEIIRPINPNKLIIIGNSLGGLVALTCAVMIPEEISGIIASPLPDPINIKINKSLEKTKLRILKKYFFKVIFYLLPIKIILFFINRLNIIKLGLKSAYFKQDRIDKELLNIVEIPAKRSTASRALRSMCIGMVLRSNKLKSNFLLKILDHMKTVPFLLIWGEKDNFIPLFFGKRIANQYPWVKLVIVANAGHCVHDEDYFNFNKISHEWIKKLKTLQK